MSFLENQHFFTQNYLSGENTPNLEDDNFWDVSVSLPNIVRPNSASPSMPSIETSNLGGELLQKGPNDLNPKFKFYARRRFNQLNKDQIADSSQIQSPIPKDDSETPSNNLPLLFLLLSLKIPCLMSFRPWKMSCLLFVNLISLLL